MRVRWNGRRVVRVLRVACLLAGATMATAPRAGAQDMPPTIRRSASGPTTMMPDRGPAVGLTGRQMVGIGLGIGVAACVLAGGVMVLIRDLRPKSVSEWISRSADRKSRRRTDAERRQVEIGIGSQILRDLGVADMVLLSNTPPSRYVGLEAFGLRIVGHRKIG